MLDVYRNRQAPFDGFSQIGAQFFHRLALRGTSRNRRHFRPEPTFLGLMDNGMNFHENLGGGGGS